MKPKYALTLFMWMVMSSLAATATAQDTIKIAFIEGLSGPFANVGEIGLRQDRDRLPDADHVAHLHFH